MSTIKTAAKILGIYGAEITVCGSRYLVTRDTGEIAYGAHGECAFAYDATAETDRSMTNYGAFCDAFSPVGPDDLNWLELAVALAVRGYRLTVAGSCTPALTEREYQIARIAAEMAD